MSYKRLYEHVQTCQLHVERKVIREKILELTGAPGVRTVASTLDPEICRGLYISPRNTNHPVYNRLGGHIIVVARGLNRCWTRYIYFKEMMHMLDGDESATDSGHAFETVLTEISGSVPPERSKQTQAEILAMWGAICVFCPEQLRIDLQNDRNRGHITDYGIALKLRMPEKHVPALFGTAYQNALTALLS
jgi:hypothetical protein